jgi:hypothetical protein
VGDRRAALEASALRLVGVTSPKNTYEVFSRCIRRASPKILRKYFFCGSG